MVRDTPPSQDVSTHQIWNSYLKEYRRYGPDTKAGRTHGRTDGRTVRLLYASQSSFGGIKTGFNPFSVMHQSFVTTSQPPTILTYGDGQVIAGIQHKYTPKEAIIVKSVAMTIGWSIPAMRGSRRFCQRGSNFDIFGVFLVDEGREIKIPL